MYALAWESKRESPHPVVHSLNDSRGWGLAKIKQGLGFSHGWQALIHHRAIHLLHYRSSLAGSWHHCKSQELELYCGLINRWHDCSAKFLPLCSTSAPLNTAMFPQTFLLYFLLYVCIHSLFELASLSFCLWQSILFHLPAKFQKKVLG